MIFVDFPADDGLRGFGFAAAVGPVGGSNLLEVVNVVDEAAFNLVHAGIDVAGNGDVDEEHGAVAAALKEVLAVGVAEDLLRGAGAGDDDVGTVGLLVDSLEGDHSGENRGASEFSGEFFGAGQRTIGDENGGGAVLDEVTRGEFGHLACAD